MPSLAGLPMTWLVCGAPRWSPNTSSLATAFMTARRSATGRHISSSRASWSQSTRNTTTWPAAWMRPATTRWSCSRTRMGSGPAGAR